MPELIPTQHLIIPVFFVLMALFILLGLEKYVNKVVFFFVAGSVVLFTIITSFGLVSVILFILSLFVFWAFLFGFTVNRTYLYLLALIFLAITPFLMIFDYPDIAELSAILAFLMLVMGVVKDIFYEKVFDE